MVLEACEKKVICEAIAGVYYFENASVFIEAAKKVLIKDSNVNNNFYISSSLNEIILENKLVMAYSIDSQYYHSFYSPSKINEFEKSVSMNPSVSKTDSLVNILIPAAGNGTRFAKMGWKKPKPFIDINNQSMLERVIDNIKTRDCSLNVMLRKEHIDAHPQIVSRLSNKCDHIVPVPSLTEGTASTVLLARHIINSTRPLLIANSDQLVSFDIDDFIDDFRQINLDGSIVVFKDKSKNPKWSFARTNDENFRSKLLRKSQFQI